MKIKAVRKLGKNTKYSYSINISAKMIKALGWRTGQKLIIEASSKLGRILIKDWERK
tara:strand:+ start:1225 stop:1395 length:171 start_codon:yes stop_codon:yes gene_type:complete